MLLAVPQRDVVFHAGRSAATLFYLLFPVYFIYNFLSAKLGYKLPVIGGGYFIYCILFLPLSLFFLARTITTRMPIMHHLSLMHLALITIAPFAWSMLSSTEKEMLSTISGSATYIVSFITLYFVGLYLPLLNNRFVKSIKVLLYLSCAIVVFTVITGNGVSFTPIYSISQEHVITASYQGYARSISVILLVSLLFSQSISSRLIVTAIGITTLFLIGARSELYGTGLAIMAILMFWSIKSYKWFSCSVLAMCVFSTFIAFNLDTILQSRQALVFTGLEGTSSWDARESMSQIAIDQIYASPLVGDYKAYEDFGEGSYAHNILSAWVDFGLAGVLLYLTMIVAALYISAVKFISYNGKHAGWGLCLAFSLMTFVLSLVSKSVYWDIPALTFGLVVSMQLRERHRRQHLVESSVARH